MKAKNLGIFSAIFASICCIGPLILVLVGLGGLGLGAVIGKYHWWFLGGGVLLVSIAWRYYFKEKKTCELKACQMQNKTLPLEGRGRSIPLDKRTTQFILTLATLIVVFFIGLNLYTYSGKSSEITKTTVIADSKTIVIPVEGMTCLTCEITVRSAIKKVEGVISASASAKEKSAKVTYDPAKTNIEQLVEAINKTGYKASTP